MNINNTVYQGDTIELIKNISDDTIGLILSDIPYGIDFDDWDVLHDNNNSALGGASQAQKQHGKVFQRRGKPLNGWSEADKNRAKEYQDWVSNWASEWFRVLKTGSSCFIFAGRQNQHRVIVALEDVGFTLRDVLSWEKNKAPHRAQRLSKVFERRGDTDNMEYFDGWRLGNLRPIHEPILWFQKPYKIGTTLTDNMLSHGVGAWNEKALFKFNIHNDGKLKQSSNILKVKEHSFDKHRIHPTQKPINLLRLLIELTTFENEKVLDPFAGSGSTIIASMLSNRQAIGFEMNDGYIQGFNNLKKQITETKENV